MADIPSRCVRRGNPDHVCNCDCAGYEAELAALREATVREVLGLDDADWAFMEQRFAAGANRSGSRFETVDAMVSSFAHTCLRGYIDASKGGLSSDQVNKLRRIVQDHDDDGDPQ